MELRFTRHAREKMIERGITEDMVSTVLDAPRWMPATTRNVRYDSLVSNRRLAVVIASEVDPPLVVTVFFADEE